MDGSSELEVTAETDGEVVDPSLLVSDGEKVGECLRGVIVTAVARIDYRDERVLGCNEGCALLGVTHSDDINVAADYRNGIRNAFAL